MLKTRRFWLGLAITLIFIGLLFYRTSLTDIIAPLKSANYLFVLPAVAVYFVGFWFKVARWSYILKPIKAVPTRKLFSTTVIGYAVNNLLPFRIGELVRAYLVGEKEGITKSSALGTIVVERIFDGLALVFMVVAISVFIPMDDWLKGVTILMALLFAGFLGLFIFLAASPVWTQKILDWIACCLPRRFGQPLKGLAVHFISGIKILHSPGRLLVVFGYSLLLWIIEAAMSWVLAFSFREFDMRWLSDPLQAYPVFLVGTATANLATTLPTTQGGIGPFEYFYKQTLLILGPAGTADSLATTYAVVLHVVLLVPLIVLGLVYLWTEHLSFSQLTRRSMEVKTTARHPPTP
ncbi:MAG: flippase-like domain-containing protein [Chloroflexi bacterium]|nr:flippase-like domain-containing protein [Chloroflexota bacterium]